MPVINPVVPAQVIPSEEGPCNWALDTSCCPDWDTYAPAVQSAATAWATYLLWALTGRQYGACSVSVRPCGKPCAGFSGYQTWPVGPSSGSGSPWMAPFVDNGVWRNCVCSGGCSCRAACEVILQGPVAVIDEVMIDGVVLDPSAYRVDRDERGSVLVRVDGECWPECQDMDAAPDAAGAFTVTYQQGVLVPRAGQIAAGMLACQFVKACAGGDCVLPQQLQSLTRNGIQVEVLDASADPAAILTGIAEVDRWIRAVNPANLRMRPRVLSSDVRPHRVVTP